MAKNSEAKIKANNKYTKKAYRRLSICIRNELRQEVELRAKQCGSINAYINQLIKADLEKGI